MILAIRGDEERGSEVIALLEMMGGNNVHNLYGDENYTYYVIEGVDNEIRGGIYIFADENLRVFTLDEFKEKYPYKVGDVVKTGTDEEGIIKQIKWVNDDIVYWVESNKTCKWTQTLSVDVLDKYNRLKSNDIEHIWATTVETNKRDREDVLFDSIIWHLRNSVNNGKQHLSGGDCETYFRELVKKVKENDMNTCKSTEKMFKQVAYLTINEGEFADEVELNLDGYEIEIRDGKTYAVRKKPTYPKLTNLTECKEILGEKNMYQSVSGYKGELLTNFQLLFIFRDVYWKIAGEQMGLGKSWEPNDDTEIYNIYRHKNTIRIGGACWGGNCNILEFPTEEIRDAFYENFKDLIENCKELL